MGRIPIRGEAGHDIVPELYPAAGEVVIDKPGKGAFSPPNSKRSANDRGYECMVLSDCVGSYFPEFQASALAMIKAQSGIFGWVSDPRRALAALAG